VARIVASLQFLQVALDQPTGPWGLGITRLPNTIIGFTAIPITLFLFMGSA